MHEIASLLNEINEFFQRCHHPFTIFARTLIGVPAVTLESIVGLLDTIRNLAQIGLIGVDLSCLLFPTTLTEPP